MLHVRWRTQSPYGNGQFLGENVAAHCNVTFYNEPVQKRVLDGVQIPQGEEAIFGNCPDHSRPKVIFAAAVTAVSFQCSLFNRQ